MSEPNSDWQRYNIEQAIKYSIEAVKSVLLMNGAAAIALLAFMGANAGKEDPLVEVSIELFKLALMCFGGGASLCALTFLFAYIAQLFFAGISSSETHVWPANLFRLLAMICFVSAIVMFGVGVYVAAEALSIPRLRQTIHPRPDQRRWNYPCGCVPSRRCIYRAGSQAHLLQFARVDVAS